jgi:hypothetical protein
VKGFVVGGVRFSISHVVGQYLNKDSSVIAFGENAPDKSYRRRSAAKSAEKNFVKSLAKKIYIVINLHTLENTLL